MAPFPEGLDDIPPHKEVNKELFERVWKVVKECGEEERHFNQLQGIYRGLASTWILATLGAVGYLLFPKDQAAITLSKTYFVAATVCFVCASGVFLISILDLIVYHELLEAVFQQGCKLEQEFEWLPQFRTNMLGKKKGLVRKSIACYYVGTIGVPLIASFCFMVLFLNDLKFHCCFWVAISLLAIALGLLTLFFLTMSRTPSELCVK
jgi:hypothetical protein